MLCIVTLYSFNDQEHNLTVWSLKTLQKTHNSFYIYGLTGYLDSISTWHELHFKLIYFNAFGDQLKLIPVTLVIQSR